MGSGAKCFGSWLALGWPSITDAIWKTKRKIGGARTWTSKERHERRLMTAFFHVRSRNCAHQDARDGMARDTTYARTNLYSYISC